MLVRRSPRRGELLFRLREDSGPMETDTVVKFSVVLRRDALAGPVFLGLWLILTSKTCVLTPRELNPVAFSVLLVLLLCFFIPIRVSFKRFQPALLAPVLTPVLAPHRPLACELLVSVTADKPLKLLVLRLFRLGEENPGLRRQDFIGCGGGGG